MTTAKHTPGPWYTNTKGDNRYQSEIAREGDGKTVAITYTSNDADAHLIAAAPDLLAACKALMLAEGMQSGKRDGVTMGLISSAIDAARAAIAKAQGGAA